MAFLNEQTGELHLKVLITGAGGVGKTTFLQSLYKLTNPGFGQDDNQCESLTGTFSQRSKTYEFLPISLGEFQGQNVRINLYTFPSHSLMPLLESGLCIGVDGILTMADSRLVHLHEYEPAVHKLQVNLEKTGLSYSKIPRVCLLNFRDCKDIVPTEIFKSGFHLESHRLVETIALRSVGVLESVEFLAEEMISCLEHSTNSLFHNSPSLEISKDSNIKPF